MYFIDLYIIVIGYFHIVPYYLDINSNTHDHLLQKWGWATCIAYRQGFDPNLINTSGGSRKCERAVSFSVRVVCCEIL